MKKHPSALLLAIAFLGLAPTIYASIIARTKNDYCNEATIISKGGGIYTPHCSISYLSNNNVMKAVSTEDYKQCADMCDGTADTNDNSCRYFSFKVGVPSSDNSPNCVMYASGTPDSPLATTQDEKVDSGEWIGEQTN